MCLIKALNISRKYGTGNHSVTALKQVNLQISRHRLVSLKGSSGSGKTTLINLLGVLDEPSNGQIFFDGSEITGLSEKDKVQFRKENIGFIFQSSGLVPMMTAYENVELGLRIAGIPRNKWKESIEESLSFVGLSERAKHFPSELSGGEQQRCAIARAIAHKPQVILADEPTAELDGSMGLRVIQVFKELIQTHSITVVLTTHDPMIMELADDIYELEDGLVENKNR